MIEDREHDEHEHDRAQRLAPVADLLLAGGSGRRPRTRAARASRSPTAACARSRTRASAATRRPRCRCRGPARDEQHGRERRGTARCTGASCGSRCATRPRSPRRRARSRAAGARRTTTRVPLLSSDCTDEADSTITTPMTFSTATTMTQQQVGRGALRCPPWPRRAGRPATRSTGRGARGSGSAVVLTRPPSCSAMSAADLPAGSRHPAARSSRTSRTTRRRATAARCLRARRARPRRRPRRASSRHGPSARAPPSARSTSSGVSPIATTPDQALRRRGQRCRGRRPCCRPPASSTTRSKPSSALSVAWGFVAFESSKYSTPEALPTGSTRWWSLSKFVSAVATPRRGPPPTASAAAAAAQRVRQVVGQPRRQRPRSRRSRRPPV